MDQRLKDTIDAARETYLRNADRLATMARRRGAKRQPDTAEIFMWLAGIDITLSERMGKRPGRGADGYAHGSTQSIRLNPFVVRTTSDDDLLDLVLHEMGHLFTWHFFGTIKHDADWQHVGFVVGYIPIGSQKAEHIPGYVKQMLTYRMAAAVGMPHPELGY